MTAIPFAFEQLEGAVVEATASSGAARAAAIVEAAQAEAELIATAAQERGYADGLAAAAAELEPARAALEAACTEVRGSLAELTAAAEREAVALALELAEKILAVELGAQPERVLDVVAGALRGVAERALVLEVHPDDAALVAAAVELEVVPERRVARGGCIVRTAEGEIDAGIGEQLARAAEVLRDPRG